MAGTLISPGAVLREDLSGAVAGYDYSEEAFIGTLVLPPYGVNKRSGQFNYLQSKDYLRRVYTRRRPGGPASRSTDALGRGTWDINEYAHEKVFDPSNTDAYRDLTSAEMAKATMAALITLRDYERDAAGLLFNETNFPPSGNTGLTVATIWSNQAAATPIDDVVNGHAFHKIRHGRMANTLVLNDIAYRNFCRTAQVTNQIKYVNSAVNKSVLPLETVADLCMVKRVIVAGNIYDTADEGAAVSGARAWSSTYAQLLYISNGQNDLETVPQLGRTMMLNVDPESPGITGARDMPIDGAEMMVEEYADPGNSSKIFRAKTFRQPMLLNVDCGYLLKGVS